MKAAKASSRVPSQDASAFDWLPNQTTPPVASNTDTGFGYNQGESLLLRDSANFSYGTTTGARGTSCSTIRRDAGDEAARARRRYHQPEIARAQGPPRVRKPAEMIATRGQQTGRLVGLRHRPEEPEGSARTDSQGRRQRPVVRRARHVEDPEGTDPLQPQEPQHPVLP
jgi:hypothetical protein